MVARHGSNSHSRVYTLEKSVIKKFPTFVFHKNDSNNNSNNSSKSNAFVITIDAKSSSKNVTNEIDVCSICIDEFNDGDTLRMLPKCSHKYHKDCIGTYYFVFILCPLYSLYSPFTPYGLKHLRHDHHLPLIWYTLIINNIIKFINY